ncbi:pilus assembly protein [Enterovibrio makurazakiensis]|uniref:Pilus assembly protein n=1 Tax=Enterovibrio gelatinilyticus TaxID=2899819 RepID=A0ABT5R2Z3_9GAMM|nr:TadE/TadG family type IV pilus assembly protein [Enterovibrio sp. ZSDZ42]MDD1794647.1 pilus assembly protein [Enterovibrio sp. ZSDZ42]
MRSLRRKHTRRKNQQSGVITLEFAIGFPLLFFFLMFWVEICVIGYLSSVVDYAISESSRTARSSANANYESIFRTAISNSNDFWTKVVDPTKFSISVEFYDSLDSAASRAGTVLGSDKPIALYQVSYEYEPMFSYLYDAETLNLSREVIAIQEFERDQFSQ